ncbi:hypothetical protein B0J11DRAFT_7271 [Dendryphion nanum]|uniref:Uncharacterized protein n=1 Tax=Dendryphion nanum TaxID=256645 RepID=A0A9P9IY65_9PLEO|nr:hypothetical protein B0J11DRAFT_7271 [Dendryphion nanum]
MHPQNPLLLLSNFHLNVTFYPLIMSRSLALADNRQTCSSTFPIQPANDAPREKDHQGLPLIGEITVNLDANLVKAHQQSRGRAPSLHFGIHWQIVHPCNPSTVSLLRAEPPTPLSTESGQPSAQRHPSLEIVLMQNTSVSLAFPIEPQICNPQYLCPSYQYYRLLAEDTNRHLFCVSALLARRNAVPLQHSLTLLWSTAACHRRHWHACTSS